MIAPNIDKEQKYKWPNEKVDRDKKTHRVGITRSIERIKNISPITPRMNLTDSEGLTLHKLLTEAADAIGNRLQSSLEDTFKQRLLEDGLLSEIKPIHDLPDDKWTPIRAKGKPVSEIVIEERR